MSNFSVGFSCKLCGMKDKICSAPAPVRFANEGVEKYIVRCMEVAGAEHRLLSPLCTADKLDLMVPITQAGIGFPGEPLTEQQRQELMQQLNEP